MFLVISVTFAFAQKANVSKAKNKALMENPDFTGARELIKPALTERNNQGPCKYLVHCRLNWLQRK